MKGWVYVISNKAMPGIVKIGYTMKDPDIRALGLNPTDSPHPYLINYEALLDHPKLVEKKTHEILNNYLEGKEWFRYSVQQATLAIEKACNANIHYSNSLETPSISDESSDLRQTKGNACAYSDCNRLGKLPYKDFILCVDHFLAYQSMETTGENQENSI